MGIQLSKAAIKANKSGYMTALICFFLIRIRESKNPGATPPTPQNLRNNNKDENERI